MTDDHDLYREWAAAYVLGALEPAERAEYERHLRTCSTCQEDVKEFAAIPGLLSQVDPATNGASEDATRLADLAVARAGNDVAGLQRSARRWRRIALGSAAAAGIAIVSLVAIGTGDDPAPDRGTPLAFEADAVGSVHVDGRAWGTWIWLDLEGLPERDAYQLWAVDRDGAWFVAATWRPTPQGLARLTGAAAVDLEALDRVVITSADPDDVLLSASA